MASYPLYPYKHHLEDLQDAIDGEGDWRGKTLGWVNATVAIAVAERLERIARALDDLVAIEENRYIKGSSERSGAGRVDELIVRACFTCGTAINSGRLVCDSCAREDPDRPAREER